MRSSFRLHFVRGLSELEELGDELPPRVTFLFPRGAPGAIFLRACECKSGIERKKRSNIGGFGGGVSQVWNQQGGGARLDSHETKNGARRGLTEYMN